MIELFVTRGLFFTQFVKASFGINQEIMVADRIYKWVGTIAVEPLDFVGQIAIPFMFGEEYIARQGPKYFEAAHLTAERAC